MAKPFKGTINVDIRESEPDWTPFEPPVAPYEAPSVLYIVLDDVGFSAMSCYGGPVETPNIDRIAAQGDLARLDDLGTTRLTIKRVQVNVSGKPYVDLEREAVAMMARE